jgi:hypothetical protein
MKKSGLSPSLTRLYKLLMKLIHQVPESQLQVGDQKKYTSVKESTNCPYYNEVTA